MRTSIIANRYAKALFDLSVENKSQDRVFSDLRALDQIFGHDRDLHVFMTTPLIRPAQRIEVLEKALKGKELAVETYDLVMLLARKNRLGIFHQLVSAFEAESDRAHNVCRGTVRSATALGQADRQRIEETVERVLNKKVIMSYKVDPSVIGGLVAQVGSYTFDDSIASHLQRMNEELKRRSV